MPKFYVLPLTREPLSTQLGVCLSRWRPSLARLVLANDGMSSIPCRSLVPTTEHDGVPPREPGAAGLGLQRGALGWAAFSAAAAAAAVCAHALAFGLPMRRARVGCQLWGPAVDAVAAAVAAAVSHMCWGRAADLQTWCSACAAHGCSCGSICYVQRRLAQHVPHSPYSTLPYSTLLLWFAPHLCAAVTVRDVDPTAPLGVRRGIQTQIEVGVQPGNVSLVACLSAAQTAQTRIGVQHAALFRLPWSAPSCLSQRCAPFQLLSCRCGSTRRAPTPCCW